MSEKLVKEIITTTTERFGDNGGIKERITESKQKIYEEIPVAKEEVPELVMQEPVSEELIKKTAEKLDKESAEKHKEEEATPVAPKYNRVSQPAPAPSPGAFPWEQPQ